MFRDTEDASVKTDWIVTAMRDHTKSKLFDLDILQEEYNLDNETVQLLAERFKDQLKYLKSISPDSSVKDILEGMTLPLVK